MVVSTDSSKESVIRRYEWQDFLRAGNIVKTVKKTIREQILAEDKEEK